MQMCDRKVSENALKRMTDVKLLATLTSGKYRFLLFKEGFEFLVGAIKNGFV